MTVQYLGNGNPDGTSLGYSATEKVSLFGVTPVTQRTNIADVTTATVTTAATSTTPWGFATSTQADAVMAMVADLRTKFNTLLVGLEAIGTHATS